MLNHYVVHLKLTKYFMSTILQFKKTKQDSGLPLSVDSAIVGAVREKGPLLLQPMWWREAGGGGVSRQTPERQYVVWQIQA